MRTLHRRPPRARLGPRVLALAALTALGGCHVEPWVKPYERDHLADPVMSFDRNPVSSAYTDHVHEVREGSRGATGSAGGGCGCN
jgi:hypothetical protein